MFSSLTKPHLAAKLRPSSQTPSPGGSNRARNGGPSTRRPSGLHGLVASLAVAVCCGCGTGKRSFGALQDIPDASTPNSDTTGNDASVATSGDAMAESETTNQLTVWVSSEGPETNTETQWEDTTLTATSEPTDTATSELTAWETTH